MNKQQITQRQGTAMVALYTIGSTVILGISKFSKQDAWISVLIALAAMLPLIYIYSRILSRYPGMHLFDICLDVFGKVIGRVIVALYVWYALHLGALVLRDFSEFIQVTTFRPMPQTISLVGFIALIIWATRRGPEVMARYSMTALVAVLAIIGGTVALLVKDMHFENLLPVGENLYLVPKDAIGNFAFPFAETVLFLAVLHAVSPKGKPGRAWLNGLLISGATILFGLYMRNLLVLGTPMMEGSSFTSYNATSVIIAGGFISRIENVVGANLLLAGLVKVGVCLLAASLGFSTLLGDRDFRPYVAPLGLIMAALASIIYENMLEMFNFLSAYPYYAFPFQVILPVALCIGAEIKHAVRKKKAPDGAEKEIE